MSIPCRSCRRGHVPVDLDLGTAAFCVEAPTAAVAARALSRHPFRLGTCSDCGVVQLLDLPPLAALRPAERAILYRDPERHLDDLARATASVLPSSTAFILGMSYKDAPLLDRFAALGLTHQKNLDRDTDWGLSDPRYGIETMQARCTTEWAESIRNQYGRVDLLIVRHVLEHAHDPPAFLAACRRLIEPNGLLLIEVPGCDTEFARGDCGALWEEHVSYFTADSLRRTLMTHGFYPRLIGNYPYTVEDCLAAVAQCGTTQKSSAATTSTLVSDLRSGRERLRTQLQHRAEVLRQSQSGIAVYGAGHRTATWLELAGIADVVTCVIDDDPSKQGRYLAGSGIPVGPAAWLIERNIGLCLGLISAEILQRIAVRESAYISRGGRFVTMDDLLCESSDP